MSTDQHIVRVLRDAPGQRRVLLTRRGERLLATRFFLRPIKRAFDGLVGRATVTGEGSIGGLPEEVALALEGYRVRAALGEMPGLPRVVAAGVSADEGCGAGLPEAGEGLGYAYVSTEFVAGESLAHAAGRLGCGEKLALLRRLLALLSRLHARGVVYGDLKPQNVVAVGDEPWLIDLDTMRRVAGPEFAVPTRDLTVAYAAPEQRADHLTYLASDVYSFGKLGSWLLESELAAASPHPAAALWRPLLTRAMAENPSDRPEARKLASEIGADDELAREGAEAATVPVDDLDADAAGAPAADAARTGAARAGEAAGGAPAPAAGPRPEGGEAAGEIAPAPNAAGHEAASRRAVGRTAAEGAKVAAGSGIGGEGSESDRPGKDGDGAGAHASARRRRAARVWLGAGLLAAAVAPAGIFVADFARGAAAEGEEEAAADPALPDPDAYEPPDAGPLPFRDCEEGADRVVVATVAEGDPIPSPSELLSWFSAVSPASVDVYRYEDERANERRISFELAEGRWPDWRAAADGRTGEARCERVGRELAERGLGPPAGPHRNRELDFVFEADRPDALTDVERVGDLRDVVDGEAFAAIRDWLDPLEVAPPRCRSRGGWVRDASLEVECAVDNPRRDIAPARVTATMIPEGEEPSSRERYVLLEPGEGAEKLFEFDDYDDRRDAYCECSASTLSH